MKLQLDDRPTVYERSIDLSVTFNDERALDRASGAKALTLTKVAMSARTLNIFSVFVVKSDLL